MPFGIFHNLRNGQLDHWNLLDPQKEEFLKDFLLIWIGLMKWRHGIILILKMVGLKQRAKPILLSSAKVQMVVRKKNNLHGVLLRDRQKGDFE